MGTDFRSSKLFPVAVVVGMLVGAFYLYGCYGVVKSVRLAYSLSSRGVPAVAKVTNRTPVWIAEGNPPPRGTRRFFHDLEFDGHEGTITLEKQLELGGDINVLYLRESPDICVPAEPGESFGLLWLRMPQGGSSESLAIWGSFVLLFVGMYFSWVLGLRFVRRVGRRLWSRAGV